MAAKRSEEALEAPPDGIDTRAIALRVIEAKGLDASDRLAEGDCYKAVQVLRRQEKRGEVSRVGKRRGTVVGQLPLVNCP